MEKQSTQVRSYHARSCFVEHQCSNMAANIDGREMGLTLFGSWPIITMTLACYEEINARAVYRVAHM